MLPLDTGKQLAAHVLNQPREGKISSAMQQRPEIACIKLLVQ